LRPICGTAIAKCELVPVVRYLMHLAAWLGAAERGSLTRRVARYAIASGARAVGLAPWSEAQADS